MCFGFLLTANAQAPHAWTAEELMHYVFEQHVARSATDLIPALRRQQETVRFQPAPLQISGFYLAPPGGSALPTYTEWQVDQSGVLPPAASARRAVTEAAEASGEADRQLQLQLLWWEVADHVLGWLALDEEMEVMDRQVAAFEEVLAAVELRCEAGEATVLEVEQARWGVAQAVTERSDLKARREALRLRLAGWCTGAAPVMEVTPGLYEVLGPLEVPAAGWAEEAAVEAAVAYAEAERVRAERERWPEWTLGYNAQGVSGEVYGGVFAGLAIPLRGARSSAELAALEAARVRHEGGQQLAQALADRAVWKERYDALLQVRPVWSMALAEAGSGLDLAQTKGHLTVVELHQLINARFQAERELIHLDEELRRLRARLLTSIEMPQP